MSEYIYASYCNDELCFSLPFPVGCSSQILIPQQVYSLRKNKCTYCNLLYILIPK
jgi:hypothetical protein